jgi:hypothetical protein
VFGSSSSQQSGTCDIAVRRSPTMTPACVLREVQDMLVNTQSVLMLDRAANAPQMSRFPWRLRVAAVSAGSAPTGCESSSTFGDQSSGGAMGWRHLVIVVTAQGEGRTDGKCVTISDSLGVCDWQRWIAGSSGCGSSTVYKWGLCTWMLL